MNVGGTHTVSIQHLYYNINKRIVHTTVVELLTSHGVNQRDINPAAHRQVHELYAETRENRLEPFQST